MKKYSRIRADIDLDAVLYNFENMKANIRPGCKITAVIKADGYGHGSVQIAELMEPYDYMWGFAVAAADEAFRLRRAGIRKPIMLLGYTFDEFYEDLIRTINHDFCDFLILKQCIQNVISANRVVYFF